MGFLTRNRRSPIALDIGAGGVKMLQLVASGSDLRVAASGRWDVPQAVPEEPGVNRERLIQEISSILREGRFKGRNVITSLSSSDLRINNIRLPHLGPDEMYEAILDEARSRLKFPIEPDQLRYLDAGGVREGTESREEIIVFAAPQEVIDDHLRLLDDLGLQPMAIDAQPIASFRAFGRRLRRQSDEETVTVVVEVGVDSTRVLVARGRDVLFIKRIDIGGRTLTQATADQLGLSLDEAHDLRMRVMREFNRDFGPRPEGTDDEHDEMARLFWAVYDGMRDKAIMLAREISLCLRYCSVTFRGLRPDRVFVTGGNAYDPAMLALFNEHTGVQCEVGKPLQGIDLSDDQLRSDRRGALAEWAVCCGMALRGLESSRKNREADDARYRLSA